MRYVRWGVARHVFGDKYDNEKLYRYTNSYINTIYYNCNNNYKELFSIIKRIYIFKIFYGVFTICLMK